MEQVLVDLVLSGGLHAVLAVGVVVLWRENQRLHRLLEQIAAKQIDSHSELLKQTVTLDRIDAQTNDKA